MKQLNQPYYIEPRAGENHIELNGEWDFFWSDKVLESFEEEPWKYRTVLPKSIYHSLQEAGLLPDPYKNTNSRLYEWTDHKIWYYRKRFSLHRETFHGCAFLCFDGVAYYSRVWVNGTLMGCHEGMFGGPCMDITPYLNLDGENEIIAEVKACNYDCPEAFDSWNKDGTNTQIVPWNIARDRQTSNGDFIVTGIWNRVRIELIHKIHISRPYIYTQKADSSCAQLYLEFEISNPLSQELKPYYGYYDDCYSYTRAYDSGLSGSTTDCGIQVHISVTDPRDGNLVYEDLEAIPLTDYENLGMDPDYHELQFFCKSFEIANPVLWYPHGLGEPHLYDVRLTLLGNGEVLDVQTLHTGIRTFTARRTAGQKYRSRWENFLFSVNGKDLFIKGMNWMPTDFLYHIDPKEYEWCLTLAKNAGIQLLRVWSGGGMPETDIFYEICDRLGIMVWQDHLLANMTDTSAYPQEILESQEAYNLYRIRNHPSLVLHCGGNEFNPYSEGNAASMFVIERTVRTLDPSRIFHYTTADKGSAHIYLDMEPVWYRHRYKQLPFLSESGIHCFPSFRTFKQVIDENELYGILPDLSSEEFVKNYPCLVNHFTEYLPERVPRMLSRASQIADIAKLDLEGLCEATQVQSYEFYTLMIQAMLENYPVCGGVMPWVFKRPWPTVGIQTVDGLGQPLYPYYAVQNAYRSVNICLCLEWSIIAPLEQVPLKAKLLHTGSGTIAASQIVVTVYSPELSEKKQYTAEYLPQQAEYEMGVFCPDAGYTDQCFLIDAALLTDTDILARTTYFLKCTGRLADKALYHTCRTTPCPNLYFEKGPWLKDCITHARKADLRAKLLASGKSGNYRYADISLHNPGTVPAYPVTVEAVNEYARFFADDNFFLLAGGEKKKIRITYDLDKGEQTDIAVRGWNFTELLIGIEP